MWPVEFVFRLEELVALVFRLEVFVSRELGGVVDVLELVPAPVSVPVPEVPVLSLLQAANSALQAIKIKIRFITISSFVGFRSLLQTPNCSRSGRVQSGLNLICQ